ncbi:MAG: hydantoinase B/oxoprolinase family protein, partial [Deltaproteobacteria bacterium]|nr:hydantoinase B/oxoprolinase family protein [Deltaproteobacteria bacterium]
GGAGEYRGGLSLRRDTRFLTDATWARYSDRQKFKPQGLFGGKEGTKGELILNPGTTGEQKQKSKGVTKLKAGDVLSIRLPGSGGYGDPRKRDPETVRWDVLNGKVSLESARDNYLVVFNDDLTINEDKTQSLRPKAKVVNNL